MSLLILILLFSNCETKQKETKNITLEKDAINKVIDMWHNNAAEANYEGYFGAMTGESIFIGTDASENWNQEEFKNFSKPYFDKKKAWNFKPIKRNLYISSNGEVAWFDELLDTWMGICRGSGVLGKNGDEWKIEHYVLSLTIPNSNITEVIKINKHKDSLILKKLRQ